MRVNSTNEIQVSKQSPELQSGWHLSSKTHALMNKNTISQVAWFHIMIYGHKQTPGGAKAWPWPYICKTTFEASFERVSKTILGLNPRSKLSQDNFGSTVTIIKFFSSFSENVFFCMLSQLDLCPHLLWKIKVDQFINYLLKSFFFFHTVSRKNQFLE